MTRYGWVPEWDEVPIDVKLKYNWIKDVSVTAMEIEHAFKQKKNNNLALLFYCRDSTGFANMIPSKVSMFPVSGKNWSHVWQHIDGADISRSCAR